MRTLILVACLWSVTSPLWGKIVFHSNRDGNWEIYTMNSDGTNQTRLTFNEVSDGYPAWSTNGRQIVFHTRRHGEASDIYVMDADGNNQRRLTHIPNLINEIPNWSPDGQRIAFQRYEDDDQNHIYNIFVMDADGGNVKRLTNFWRAVDPKWSPDGQWILFEGSAIRPDGTTTRDIFAIRPDGTDLWQIAETIPDTWRTLGGWAPDGKQILYEENDIAIQSTPVIATLHPSKPQQFFKHVPVKMPPMLFYNLCFSADGKSILFSSDQDGNWNIYRLGLVDKQLTQLTDSPGDDEAPQAWNPRLSVLPQELTPTLWGEIKITR